MIFLPIPSETETLVARLSNEDKEKLALLIKAFVAKPIRNMSQVMDDMTSYARSKGLNETGLSNLLSEE